MSRIWSEQEKTECRTAVLLDNPTLSTAELDAVMPIVLEITERWEHNILFGEGSSAPIGLLPYLSEK